jgi:formate dehydrogenase major subunit
MAEIKVRINNTDIKTDDSKTILEVVRENKLDDIPTLCYEERLGHITSCFLCVVEVEGARGLVPSCSSRVTDGMVIETKSEKVVDARKTCLELFFSDHYADCISPCTQECPAGIDIQGYLSLVRKGLYREAVHLIKEKNPLPIVCGRVCVRKCEVACRRNLLDEPVAIDFLKRYAAESGEGISFTPETKPRRKKKVAIVGAGPAGLSAAYYLAVEGYGVEIFESMPHPGGMLRYGIPPYRLPKDLLDKEIDSIKKLGVDIHCNRKLGRDFTIEELRKNHDAVLLALGSWGASDMRVENENAKGVVSGLEILKKSVTGELRELKGRVLVIGGGNTAIDVSRTAVRLGADESVILYRRTEEQMPAHHEEIEAAKKEGVKFKFLIAPTRVITDEKGKATGLECQKMVLGEPDKSGRPRPVPQEGSEYVEPCNYIVAAIGQFSDLECLQTGEAKVELDRWKNIAVNKDNMETNVPGVFSAGDAVTGPATVIEGIAAGRKAALSIHGKLSGEKVRVEARDFTTRRDFFNKVTGEEVSCFECSARHPMPERNPMERIRDFEEVELGYSRQNTIEEADRCFQCGCLEADDCLLRKYGEDYDIQPTRYLGEINKYQVDRRHPFVIIDPNKCIQCGRCIRTCDRILGGSALGFVNRGFATVIAPEMDKPLADTSCISCGNCIDTCPTGALSENLPLMARLRRDITDNPAVCSFCSTGCNINIKQFGRDTRIRASRDRETGYGDYLCIKGRFGSTYLSSPERLTSPRVRTDGKLVDCNWNQAIECISDRLKDTMDKYGAESIAVFISPKLTNEEIYLANKFAKGIIGTDWVGSYRDLIYGRNRHEVDHLLGYTVSTSPMDDLLKTDVIVLVNANPGETHPSFWWKIREAREKGTKVIVIGSGNTTATAESDLWIQPKRGTGTHFLNAVIKELVDTGNINKDFIDKAATGFDVFIDFIGKHEVDYYSDTAGVQSKLVKSTAGLLTENNPRIMVVYDFDNQTDRADGDLEAVSSLLLMTGNVGKPGTGLILLNKHANTVGMYDMGAEPGYLPGRRKIEDKNARLEIEQLWNLRLPEKSAFKDNNTRNALLSGKIKAVLVIGEDPLEDPADLRHFEKLEFIAVLDIFLTKTAEYADVVLPASTHTETGGSYTRLDRKVQRFPSTGTPPAGKNNLEIITQLAEKLGGYFNYNDGDEIFNEIRQAVPFYKPVDFKNCFYWNHESECNNGHLCSGKAEFRDYPLTIKIYQENEASFNSIETYYRKNVKKRLLKRDFACISQ